MIDREKIIKGLEACSIKTGALRCLECPYTKEERGCTRKLHRDILSLLKEQEGVIPYIDIDEAKCPVCKVKLTRQELIGDDVLFEDFFDYCPHCGKPVLWEGR